MNTDFWKDKRVLITGHNGYKGCWLTKLLDSLGAVVCGISLPPEQKSGIRDLVLSSSFKEFEKDIRSEEIKKIIKDFEPEIVFHLAAQALVKVAKDNPEETFSTNVMGTVNLFEGLLECESVKSIVVVTSDKVYENIETMEGYKETDRLMGSEPYSCSKVCEEQVAKAYFETYFRQKGVSVATARACNCYGGCDFHFERLIPYLEECSYKKIKPEIRNASSVRPWIYVLDTLNGYVTLAEKLYKSPMDTLESFNFGPDLKERYTVGELAAMVCSEYEGTKEKQDYYEAGLLVVNSNKAKAGLGFEALVNLKKGMEETNKCYRDYFEGKEINAIYEDALSRYINLF